MTSKLTRERLQEIAEDGFLKHGESKELARMALVAMDSEPVAWRRFQETPNDGGYWILYDYRPNCSGVEPLYRHAQPVPEEIPIETATIIAYGLPTTNIGAIFKAGHDACRAAMLHAQSDDDGEPTDDERIMAIEGIHNCERCSDEGWVVGEMGITRCACNQGNPVFKIDLNSDFIKHVKAVSEKVRAGNSPVIPDSSADMLRRWLAFGRGMQNAGSQLPHNLISETESMLAAAPQEVK